jgi:hypothetical protein
MEYLIRMATYTMRIHAKYDANPTPSFRKVVVLISNIGVLNNRNLRSSI